MRSSPLWHRWIDASPAPGLAPAVAIEIVEHRHDAGAVPVAGEELDPLARRPAQAGSRSAREVRAVDDEIAAPRRLHDLDHVPLGRQEVPMTVFERREPVA